MEYTTVILVLIFSIVLCYIEIPGILQRKSKIELWSFSSLLLLGTLLSILKSLDLPLPNPSDWVAWVYSPVSNLLKDILQ